MNDRSARVIGDRPILLLDNDFVNKVFRHAGTFDKDGGIQILDDLNRIYDVRVTDQIQEEAIKNPKAYEKDRVFDEWLRRQRKAPIATATGRAVMQGHDTAPDAGERSMVEVHNSRQFTGREVYFASQDRFFDTGELRPFRLTFDEARAKLARARLIRDGLPARKADPSLTVPDPSDRHHKNRTGSAGKAGKLLGAAGIVIGPTLSAGAVVIAGGSMDEALAAGMEAAVPGAGATREGRPLEAHYQRIEATGIGLLGTEPVRLVNDLMTRGGYQGVDLDPSLTIQVFDAAMGGVHILEDALAAGSGKARRPAGTRQSDMTDTATPLPPVPDGAVPFEAAFRAATDPVPDGRLDTPVRPARIEAGDGRGTRASVFEAPPTSHSLSEP